jgi:hypothetical protein
MSEIVSISFPNHRFFRFTLIFPFWSVERSVVKDVTHVVKYVYVHVVPLFAITGMIVQERKKMLAKNALRLDASLLRN